MGQGKEEPRLRWCDVCGWLRPNQSCNEDRHRQFEELPTVQSHLKARVDSEDAFRSRRGRVSTITTTALQNELSKLNIRLTKLQASPLPEEPKAANKRGNELAHLQKQVRMLKGIIRARRAEKPTDRQIAQQAADVAEKAAGARKKPMIVTGRRVQVVHGGLPESGRHR